MTNYTFGSQAQLTEFIENAPLYLMGSTDLWGGSNPTPFYYESVSNTVNFGYGINLVAAASDSQLKAEINSVLASLSEPVTISDSQWAAIAAGGSGGTTSSTTLQSITNALNASAEDNGPSVIQAAAATLTQYKLNGSGYSNSAVAGLEDNISGFSGLTQEAQNGLEDLQYNTGGGFLGAGIIDDLEETTPDYASAAYELAFDTSTPGNTTYESRSLIDAAQVLGLTVTIDGSYEVTSLTGTSDAKNPAIVNFLQQVASNDPSSYLGTAPVESFMNSLVSYLATQGYYVPQSGDTWSSIASFVSDTNDVTVTATQLQDMNACLPESNFSTGGLVYVPFVLTASSSFTPPAQTGSGQAFVFDPTANDNAGGIFTVGASLDPDAGELFIETTSGADAATFTAQSYEEVSYTSDVISVDITDQSAASIGTFTSNINSDSNFDVSTGASATAITVTGTGNLDITDADSTAAIAADTLSFDGNSIAGTVDPSNLDQYGRSYSLSGSTLTISNGTDTLTIDNFVNGDFGVVLDYAFTSLSIHANGISNNGLIVGSNGSTAVKDNAGTLTTITNPNYTNVFTLDGINNSGVIASTGIVVIDGFSVTGYVDSGGTFSAISDPSDDDDTALAAINDSGVLVGNYVDGSEVRHGFVDNGGTFTTIDDPYAGSSTSATGINDNGVIVGNYTDGSGVTHGFMDNSGTFTTIDVSSGFGATSMAVTGINDSNVIVGDYTDSAGVEHGFVDNGGVFIPVDAPGNGNTTVTGINDSGEIVGNGPGGGFSATMATSALAVSTTTENSSSSTASNDTNSGYYGNSNTITAGTGGNTSIFGDSNTVTAGTDGTIALHGSSNTATAGENGVVTVDSSSSYSTIYLSGDSASATDAGNAGYIELDGNSDSATVNGNGVTTTLYGESDSASTPGNNDTINDDGSGANTVTMGSYSNTANLSGTGSTGTDNGLYNDIEIDGSSEHANLDGTVGNVDIWTSGATVTVSGSGNSVNDYASGSSTVDIYNGDYNTNAIYGTGTAVYAYGGTNTSIGLDGTSETAHVSAGSSTVYDSGTSNTSTITGNSDYGNLYGDDDTATNSGNDGGIQLSGNADVGTISGTGNTATIATGGTNETVTVNGTGNVGFDGTDGTNSITLGGSSNLAWLYGASSDTITFDDGGTGMLELDDSQDFSGTVAGMGDGDGIDMSDVAYGGAHISSISGTGALGTDTTLTVTNGTTTAQIALLNQYANQFGLSSSDYTLAVNAADYGTLLQLASGH
jgi:hypothetical protein